MHMKIVRIFPLLCLPFVSVADEQLDIPYSFELMAEPAVDESEETMQLDEEVEETPVASEPETVTEPLADPVPSETIVMPHEPDASLENDEPMACEPAPRWYFAVKPGYYCLTDSSMRTFFDNGGFTIRAEAGCRVWGPLIVWMDGGYFQKEGTAIGGDERTHAMLATITLGLKAIYYFNDFFAAYAGSGPRLFMMKLKNESLYVSGEDNQIGIGGAFDAGCWIFPFARCKSYARNLFLDVFADYSLKTLETEEDLVSSEDFDVNVSGLTLGIGLGIRF